MPPASQRAPMPGAACLFRPEPVNHGAVAARSWKASRNAPSAGRLQPPFRQPSARSRRTENRPAADRTNLLARNSRGFIVTDHVAVTMASELQLGLDASCRSENLGAWLRRFNHLVELLFADYALIDQHRLNDSFGYMEMARGSGNIVVGWSRRIDVGQQIIVRAKQTLRKGPLKFLPPRPSPRHGPQRIAARPNRIAQSAAQLEPAAMCPARRQGDHIAFAAIFPQTKTVMKTCRFGAGAAKNLLGRSWHFVH